MVLTPLDLYADEEGPRIIQHRGNRVRYEKLSNERRNRLLCPRLNPIPSNGVPQNELHACVLAKALFYSRSKSLQTTLNYIFALVYDQCEL